MENARLQVQVERPVDGDTVRVLIGDKSEAVRIKALDPQSDAETWLHASALASAPKPSQN